LKHWNIHKKKKNFFFIFTILKVVSEVLKNKPKDIQEYAAGKNILYILIITIKKNYIIKII